MKNIFSISFLMLITLTLSAQYKPLLNCSDFYKGEFNNVNDNTPTLNSTVIRNGNKQIEITNGKEVYKKIEWLNDCNYSLYFNKKETKKNRFAKFINKNGGITVVTEKIEGNTLFYKTSYFDGTKNIVSTGRLTKISNEAF